MTCPRRPECHSATLSNAARQGMNESARRMRGTGLRRPRTWTWTFCSSSVPSWATRSLALPGPARLTNRKRGRLGEDEELAKSAAHLRGTQVMRQEQPEHGDPIGPLAGLRQFVPFEAAAVSDRLGWAGPEAARYPAAPASQS